MYNMDTLSEGKLKVAVGLSGGVDSAVTAYILQQAGHEVIGLTMKVWSGESAHPQHRSACYGSDESHDIEDIEKICDQIGIPFRVIDLCNEYEEVVVHYFRSEYQQGRTPNPCVICNHRLKFQLLLQKAQSLGLEFDRFATGHYARVQYNTPAERYQLLKSINNTKDQSYFLAFLNQQQLRRVLFPLGDKTKEEVRKIAREIGLKVHDKKESQDFYGGDYRELISDMPGGDIVDKDGNILGKHQGLHHYTIGQRKGLGITASHPLYVIEIDKKNNRVVAGKKEDLFRRELLVENFNWVSITCPEKSINADVRIRYRHKEAPAKIIPMGKESARVLFEDGQSAITPGQVAVAYEGEILLGGGLISRVL